MVQLPAAAAYQALLHLPLGLSAGGSFVLPLHGWINDALMAVFFLLVGLEIRREMTDGELNSVRRAAAPGVAALGGMIVPALIYVALNRGDPAALRGWAVPVATDIAFALAAISLLGRRVPVGAEGVPDRAGDPGRPRRHPGDRGLLHRRAGLAGARLAAAVLAALWGMARAGVRALGPYLIGGVLLWAAIHRSGIHATLAGVALAFVVPMRERPGEAASPAARLESALEGWVAFAILPLFGLANAGLQFSAVSGRTLADPVFLGIAGGLLLGKQVGVFGATMLAARLEADPSRRRAALAGAVWRRLLCGIGFTMSLFIGNLAFPTRPAMRRSSWRCSAARCCRPAPGCWCCGWSPGTRPGTARVSAAQAWCPPRPPATPAPWCSTWTARWWTPSRSTATPSSPPAPRSA